MSSRLAMILALILLGGAAVAGYFAWTLSQPQEPAVVVRDETDKPETTDEEDGTQAPAFDVVFAREALKSGSTLDAGQLIVHSLPVKPPDSYDSVAALTGKRLWRDVEAGELIRSGHLRAGSDLATTLLPAERAVAISVDEVVGTGGFLAPGDSVDVLLYLRETRKDGSPSAQVVLEDVRLLSFAERVQPPPDTAAKEDPERTEFRGKTAVLAVPGENITRLMLASESGSLRLALRSATSPAQPIIAGFSVTDRLITADELPDTNAEDSAKPLELDALLPEPPAPPQPQHTQWPPPKKKVQVHRGGSSESVEVP